MTTVERDVEAAKDPMSEKLAQELHEHAQHLTNGSKGDIKKISEAVATIAQSQIHMQAKVDQLPARPEVREMIVTHAQTCALARGDSASGFSIGKGGLRATGKVAFWAVVALVVVIAVAGPYVASWISAWKGEKAAEARAEAVREVNADLGVRGATNVIFVSGLERAYYDKTARTMYIPTAEGRP